MFEVLQNFHSTTPSTGWYCSQFHEIAFIIYISFFLRGGFLYLKTQYLVHITVTVLLSPVRVLPRFCSRGAFCPHPFLTHLVTKDTPRPNPTIWPGRIQWNNKLLQYFWRFPTLQIRLRAGLSQDGSREPTTEFSQIIMYCWHGKVLHLFLLWIIANKKVRTRRLKAPPRWKCAICQKPWHSSWSGPSTP